MAESGGYSTSSWGPISTGAGSQGPELVAPLHAAHALPFPQPFTSVPYEIAYGSISHPNMPPFPDVSNAPFHSHTQAHSPYPPDGGQQMYYPAPPRMYPFTPSHPRPPPAFRNGLNYPRTDLGGTPGSNDLYTRAEHLRGAQAFNVPLPHMYESPTPPATGPPQLPQLTRRQHWSMMGSSPPPRYFGAEAVRSPNSGYTDQPRQIQSPGRRTLPHEHRPVNRAYDGEVRRASLFIDGHSRRSDRSVSPRTSNRRSFDRYSFDLPQSSTSSDAEEAAARAPPSSRARHRPREVRPRFFGQHQHIDPSIATPRQIQELKERLPRRLPSELSKEVSTACDICQKDYAVSQVQPVEEEEVAIELPCGHIFGEFCIFQWVSALQLCCSIHN